MAHCDSATQYQPFNYVINFVQWCSSPCTPGYEDGRSRSCPCAISPTHLVLIVLTKYLPVVNS